MTELNKQPKQPTFEDLELLAEVSQLLTIGDLDRVLNQVIHLAMRAVGATKVSLFLHDQDDVIWSHIFTMRDLPYDKAISVVSQVLDDGFAGWVQKNKRADIIYDTATDDRWITFPDDEVVIGSVLCVPFMHQDEVIAVVTLVHPEPHHFENYHLRLMTIIANQATNAIRNAQLVSTLRYKNRQLQTILQSIRDIMLVVDVDGRIVLANASANNLIGQQGEKIIGRLLSDFVVFDEVFTPIVEIIQADLSQNEQWLFETRSERAQVDYQVTMSLWKDAERGMMGYVIVMHNITTLHDLHRFKDEMLRVATHDLRSPLALISGYAEMIAFDAGENDPAIQEYIDIIKSSVERMGKLLEDLLRIERIRNSPLELHEQTDLESLVKVVMVNMRPSAKAKSQQFSATIELKEIPKIVADPVLLRQAMENLISNAIKYTPEEGRIGARAYFDDEEFHFFVQDNGIGIPSEHLPYLFESFYRVTHESNRQKGSGLGLSLVKNVVARHGGRVWVKSQLGKGSRFGMTLPLKKQEPEKTTDILG